MGFFLFKRLKILINTINEAYKKMMMIYEIQMTKINEKTIENIFWQFIQIIDDRCKEENKDRNKLD